MSKLTHQSLTPGNFFPTISLAGLIVGPPNLKTTTLVVVYRGHFCPFCKMTLLELKAKYEALKAAGIEVIAISADPEGSWIFFLLAVVQLFV